MPGYLNRRSISDESKSCASDDYNFTFDKHTGRFARWGRTESDDPQWSPFGPEILDIEVSKNGCPNAAKDGCRWCYKGNTNAPPTNMTLATFEAILDRMPPTLCQVALGITGVQTNPDFVPMLRACRARGIVPNFTLSGIDLTPELAKEIAPLVGAVAVSLYPKGLNAGLRAIHTFHSLGVKQVNVHILAAQETWADVYATLVVRARGSAPILNLVNAFVLLGVKPKGRAAGHFHPLAFDKFEQIVKFCIRTNVPIGFDSCTCPRYEAVVRRMDLPDEEKTRLLQCSESCESGLFSAYINADGVAFPCSFTEGVDGIDGIPVLEHQSFLKVWNLQQPWRDRLLATVKDGCRHCPVYPEINKA